VNRKRFFDSRFSQRRNTKEAAAPFFTTEFSTNKCLTLLGKRQ